MSQNGGTFQTHTQTTLCVEMPNLPKIDVYEFRYKTSVGILMKLFSFTHVDEEVRAEINALNQCIT